MLFEHFLEQFSHITMALIKGLHHITAIASNAQRNYDFYTKTLGLRFVKKTVNFDDPQTYHFYYGNQNAEPGTILTFFPWEGIQRGRQGTGQATETMFAVPPDSFGFWIERFKQHNIIYNNPARRFDEEYLTFLDPDGLKLQLVTAAGDARVAAAHEEIPAKHAIQGFYGVALTLANHEATATLLTESLGYTAARSEVNAHRFVSTDSPTAAVVDVVSVPGEKHGLSGGGTIHHVAFRASNDADEMTMREQLASLGYHITPQIDRQYFHSLYFREPGGILFEIATDNPGFTVDEPLESLGTALRLPPQHEPRRAQIEAVLPTLH
jgi:glyoxalase family protein